MRGAGVSPWHELTADAADAPVNPKARVLFADADSEAQDRAAQLLAGRFSVETIGDGLAALDAARCARFDLILANVALPGLDGFALLAALRADPSLHDTPVLLTASRADPLLKSRCTEAGANDWLVAALDAPDLLARIDFHLRLARIRRESAQAVERSNDRFARFMENLPGLAWIKDEVGRYIYANRAAQAAFGKEAAELYGKTDFEIFPPETAAQFRANDRAALEGDKGTQTVEVLRHPDGTIHHSIVSKFPVPSADGASTRVGGIAIDITERRQAELALGESEERFRLVAESAPVMLWMGDHEGKCVYINRALRDFWGVRLDDLAHFDWSATLHPDDREALFPPFEHAMRTHTAFSVDARYRRADGAYRTLSTQAKPRFGPTGEFVGMIGVNVDVTDTRRAEEQRTLLINELNHRVKNTLVTVQSLAMQTFRGEGGEDARRRFEARLTALSRAHDILTRQSWQGAYLREVVDRALKPFRTIGERFTIDGHETRLSPKQALALSMALHELATNAAKYGALSNEEGRVRIAWAREGADLTLSWIESGGPPVAPPSRSGFGSRLIERSLAHDLGAAASIDFRPDGVVCIIKTALEHPPKSLSPPNEW